MNAESEAFREGNLKQWGFCERLCIKNLWV